MLNTKYYDNGFGDPPKTDTIESRLTRLIWVNDIELGGGMMVNCDIHSVDAGMWLAGARPVSAMGCSRVAREHHGNTRDMYSITYQYEDGLIHNHVGEHLYKAPIAVVGKARIAGLAGQTLGNLIIEAQIENGVHHSRHGNWCTRADRE